MLQSYIVDSADGGANEETQKMQQSSGYGHSRRVGCPFLFDRDIQWDRRRCLGSGTALTMLGTKAKIASRYADAGDRAIAARVVLELISEPCRGRHQRMRRPAH
jgi:hypothetical protein